jgi:MFS family permease
VNNHSNKHIMIMIGICMTLLFYKYLLQIFPSVMTDSLMLQYSLTGAQLGNLTAFFFYGYAITQVFAGILVDKFGLKKAASISLFIATSGMAIFAISTNIWMTMLARFMMGAGGAFATICYLRCTASWCSKKVRSLADGSLTIGVMLGAFFAEAPLALSIKHLGLQQSLLLVVVVGAGLTAISYIYLQDGDYIQPAQKNIFSAFKIMLLKTENWLLAGYSGFAFAPLAVFGGLWGTPFLQVEHHFSKAVASGIISLCYIGFGVGGPALGFLSDKTKDMTNIMLTGIVISIITLACIIYLPITNIYLLALLMIGFGFGTGGFMLGFSYGKSLNKVILAGSIVALINSGDAILGAVTEPLIGKLLDLGGRAHNNAISFSVHDYQAAFSVLLGYLCIASIFLICLRFRMRSET